MAPAQAQQCATTCALTSNNTYDSSPLQEGCTLHALLNKPHPTAPHDTWPVEFPPNAPALHTRHPVIAAHAAPVEAGSSEQHHVGTAHSDQTGPHRAATTPAGWRGQLSARWWRGRWSCRPPRRCGWCRPRSPTRTTRTWAQTAPRARARGAPCCTRAPRRCPR